jgi:hypothetical protein
VPDGRVAKSWGFIVMAAKAKRSKWKYIDKYDVATYQCGLRAGDVVQLHCDLVIKDSHENPTGEVYPAGERWRVLAGTSKDPGVVFLLQPNNEMHTWNDDQSIYEMFELVEAVR